MNTTIRKIFKLPQEDYYEKHLMILNSILPIQLTSKEIKLLANFLMLNDEDTFSSSNKKIVREKLDISQASLSNYIKELETKGFIKDKKIIELIIPNSKEQLYQFKIENTEANV